MFHYRGRNLSFFQSKIFDQLSKRVVISFSLVTLVNGEMIFKRKTSSLKCIIFQYSFSKSKKITPQNFLLNKWMLPYSPLVQFPKGLEDGLRILDESLPQENRVLRHHYRKPLLLRPALHLWHYALKRIRITNIREKRSKKCNGIVSLSVKQDTAQETSIYDDPDQLTRFSTQKMEFFWKQRIRFSILLINSIIYELLLTTLYFLHQRFLLNTF